MKHLLSAGALLLGSALAQAHPIHWAFSYTGLYDQEAQQFLPDMQLSGAFSGDDADGDGMLERTELDMLQLGTVDYVACAAGSNASYHCGADSFMFSPAAGLSFSLGAYGSDPEGWVGGGHLVESGHMRYEYAFNPGGMSERHLMWTGATTLHMTSLAPAAVNAAAVPEPGTWALLAAGLAGIGLWTRRRR